VERIVNAESRPVYRNESSANAPVNTSTTVFTVETRKLREIHLERNGTTTFAGEEMVRYTAEGVEDAPSGLGDITAYRTTILVGDDGLVQVVETRFVERNDDGDPIVYQVRMELTDLGDTFVKQPEWITNTTSTENPGARKD
jgi:hypothetical protein